MNPGAAELPFSPLPLFLILTSSLAVGSLDRNGPQAFLRRRFQRVAVPWLAWSAFYFVVNMAMNPGQMWDAIPTHPFHLLIGSTIHLWFLPFVMLISIPIALAVPMVEDAAALVSMAVLLVPLSLVGLYLHAHHALPDPFGQWSFAFPSVALGVLAALSTRHAAWWVPVGYVLVVACLGLQAGSWTDVAQLVTAAIAFEIACRIHCRHWIMLGLGRLSFGIYLMHPFFMLVYYKLAPAGLGSVIAVTSVVVMCSAATAALLRLPVARRLV
jgi:peptidoglycan/LPS O-acetylase OafA/YrhL